VRYRSADEDSARWLGLAHRPGDIVISTRSKHGTTWVQMICALLVLQVPELPAPLARLSPWVDWLVRPIEEVRADLSAQRHRRFLKTHTPLDGLPLDPRVTYLVVARHPLDAAVSLHHQSANLARARAAPQPPLADWLRAWIVDDPDPREQLDGLPGVLHHYADAWARRSAPNVVLLHHADLSADLEGAMRGLAARLAIDVPEERWPDLVAAARFDAMRARADLLAPDHGGTLRDRTAFFRRGRGGEGAALLGPDDLARYVARAAAVAPPDLLTWLHR